MYNARGMVWAMAVSACLAFPAGLRAGPPAENNDLQDRARTVLLRGLQQDQWYKVHAAEECLANGITNDIRALFLKELENAGPYYRIGVRRVLARMSEGDARCVYVDEILAVAENPDAEDRLHAVETLAKLGFDRPSEAIRGLAAQGQESMRAYASWILANGGETQPLMDLLAPEYEGLHSVTGYALRHLPSVPDAALPALRRALAMHPEPTGARANLLIALALHGAPQDREAGLRELRELVHSPEVSIRRTAYAGLGLVGGEPGRILLGQQLEREDHPDARVYCAGNLLRLSD